MIESSAVTRLEEIFLLAGAICTCSVTMHLHWHRLPHWDMIELGFRLDEHWIIVAGFYVDMHGLDRISSVTPASSTYIL